MRTFKQHDLTADEVQTSLQAGKFAAKLAIEWDEKISFVLSEDLQIKKLKFLDVLEEQIQRQSSSNARRTSGYSICIDDG